MIVEYLLTVYLYDRRPSSTPTLSEVISHVTKNLKYNRTHFQRIGFVPLSPETQGLIQES